MLNNSKTTPAPNNMISKEPSNLCVFKENSGDLSPFTFAFQYEKIIKIACNPPAIAPVIAMMVIKVDKESSVIRSGTEKVSSKAAECGKA